MYLVSWVFALNNRFTATDRADPFARHDLALLVGVGDLLGNFDGPIALVYLAPLSNLFFQFRMLLGVLGFLLGALGAIFRLPGFSLFGFLSVANPGGFLGGAQTLAEISVLRSAVGRLCFVVIDDACRDARSFARFM